MSAADELEQSFLQHFRQMKPKGNWIKEVLLDLRVVLESKEFEIQKLRRKVKKLMTERAVLLFNNKQVNYVGEQFIDNKSVKAM